MIKNVYWSSFKVVFFFLSDFNVPWIFSTDFFEKNSNQISRASVQWEPSYSMRTDGQPDMTKSDFALLRTRLNQDLRYSWTAIRIVGQNFISTVISILSQQMSRRIFCT